MTDTDDFAAERRTGIGGSDAPAVLAISAWATPYDIYRQKRGEVGPRAETPQMHWGKLLEPVILEEYCRLTGNALWKPLLQRHPVHEFMIGHIDAGVVGGPESRIGRIVEAKCARIGAGWGPPGTDDVPLDYLVQCQHYLVVTGAEICDLVVLIGGSDFRCYEILRDDEIERELIRREYEFWCRVEVGDPPDPVDLADALNRWRRVVSPGAVSATHAEKLAIEAWRSIEATRKRLDEAEEDAKQIIVEALRDRGDELIDDERGGRVLATFKMDRGRKAYSVAAREPGRRLLLKD